MEDSDFHLGNYKMALKGFENAIIAKITMPSHITMQQSVTRNSII